MSVALGVGSVLIGVVIAGVIGVIGIQIIQSTLTSANFTGLLKTVTDNIPILLGVGLLVVAVGWAWSR